MPLRVLWFAMILAAVGALVAARTFDFLPGWLDRVMAATVTLTCSWGLAARAGGRPAVCALLAAVLAGLAVATGWGFLLAGAALMTAVVAAVLAVMVTVPAPSFAVAVREVLLAVLLTSAGALAVEGYRAEVSVGRFTYLSLAMGVLGAMVLVHRLGAGLHGLGRRGLIMIVAGVAMIAIALAYSAALGRWGAPGMLDGIDWLRDQTRIHLHAVPHPIQALLGIPALAWGVFMRARRRQGWWACAFGVTATAPIAVEMIQPDQSVARIALGLFYSLVVGLVIAYAVIRVDLFLTGPRGRRAREDEKEQALRPEPGRTYALQ